MMLTFGDGSIGVGGSNIGSGGKSQCLPGKKGPCDDFIAEPVPSPETPYPPYPHSPSAGTISFC